MERSGWWARQDSNLRQRGYEPRVLTAELQARPEDALEPTVSKARLDRDPAQGLAGQAGSLKRIELSGQEGGSTKNLLPERCLDREPRLCRPAYSIVTH